MKKFIALLLLTASGCASTHMTKAWVYPERGPLEFDKVMAMIMVDDSLTRRSGEGELVSQIRRAEAVPSYQFIDDGELMDEASLKKAVADSGVEGIIVMRPVSDRQELNYVPGSYPTPYYSFWGYYGWAYPISYTPGYYRNDRIVAIETNIYDASDGKLVWSGQSETTNPKDVRKLIADTSKAVRKEMQRYGFLN